MIKIYHNARCSKSREGLCYLQEKGKEVTVINYLDEKLTFNALKDIIAILNIKPLDLVRVKEIIWKELYKDKVLTDDEIIQAMVDHPKLIERPIVINGDKGVVARPTSLIETII